MATGKKKTDSFNREVLWDGVIIPLMDDEPEPMQPILSTTREEHEARLARLRAEIQIGLDEEAAGRYYEFNSVEEFMNHIKTAGFEEDDETFEDAADLGEGRS